VNKSFRKGYWGHSKFARYVQKKSGMERSRSMTMPDWKVWHDTQKAEHPIAYWFTEEFLNDLQDVVLYPKDVLHTIKCYIRNRFITQTHMLPTYLPAGEWYEYDTRLIEGLFGCLVQYVEQDCAHQSFKCRPSRWKSFLNFITLTPHRDPQLGMHVLKQQAEFEVEQDEEQIVRKFPPAESAASQFLELYTWWTVTRPNRPDPSDVSGLTAVYEKHAGKSIYDMFEDAGREDTQAMHSHRATLEKQYEEEDTEMMIKLIKLRHHLWN